MTEIIRLNTEEDTAPQLIFYKALIKAQLLGKSSMPYQLGLIESSYKYLLYLINDPELILLDSRWLSSASSLQIEQSDTLTQLIKMRNEEREDILNLLAEHREITLFLSEFTSIIIATACLNSAHLWKSLGFDERSNLSDWMLLNFPQFASANKNMRWKRYIYLQLCKQGGDYICRAPSCDQCSSYKECFLPN